MKPAIVYLAQNTPTDLQYGRDSRSLLDRSLDLLYRNYNNQFKHDILIFHEGDFKEKDQQAVAKGRREIKFQEIHFEIPSFLPKEEVPEIWSDGWGNKFGMGHRNMIRFYAVQLWQIMPALGYDWFFRMDDDSFIHSKIEYNMFEFMEKNGYEYGYRVDIYDADDPARGFVETVRAYMTAEKLQSRFFEEQIRPARFKVLMKNRVKRMLMKWKPEGKRYRLDYDYEYWGYYNNFFITNVGFWRRPDVQAFVNHFDRIGGWFKYRWNDLIFQSAAAQVFLPRSKVYKFTDWTYEHATVKKGQFMWGGFYQGDKDSNTEARDKFLAQYKQIAQPLGRSY